MKPQRSVPRRIAVSRDMVHTLLFLPPLVMRPAEIYPARVGFADWRKAFPGTLRASWAAWHPDVAAAMKKAKP